jgi:small subunit ribosomal protein S1
MNVTEQPEKNEAPEPDEAPSAEFARALEEYDKERPAAGSGAARDISPGTKVTGRIVAIGDEWLTIDFGGRSEGVAKAAAFRKDDGTLAVAPGDELDLFVVESGDQIVLATSLHPEARAAANQLRDAKAKGMPVSGRVTGVNAGGLEVHVSGTRGFCPMSQIELGFCEDPSVYVGRTLEFLVTSVEDGRGGAVLSRRKLLRREEDARGRKLLKSIEPGQELEGTVARLEPFGAFVDLGGVDGLVHVSEIRHERVGHPGQVLTAGEKVRVKVLRLEKDKKGRKRIALSIKACTPDPWESAVERFSPGAKVTGTVARLTDFGAFVTLAPGIDGLVHVSQAADHRVEHVREVLKAGQSVEVHVLQVDPGRKRISLSLREPAAPSRATLEVEPGRPRRERGPRGRGPARRDREHERERERDHAPAEKPRGPEEPTTMALALRKAMEEAKRRGQG